MFLPKHCAVYTPADKEATVNPEDQPYMSVAEVAAYLGVTRQAAWNRTRRSGFPKPIAILRSGAVWATPDVVNFKAGEVSRRHRPAPTTREPGRTDVCAFARERLAALSLPVESAARTCTLDKRRVSTPRRVDELHPACDLRPSETRDAGTAILDETADVNGRGGKIREPSQEEQASTRGAPG
jgi:predicted DNA-binding transcriptional regulator AlpA